MGKPTIAELQRLIETEGPYSIDVMPDGSIRRRSSEEIAQLVESDAALQATPVWQRHRRPDRSALIGELLDPRVQKSERERIAMKLISGLWRKLDEARIRLDTYCIERCHVGDTMECEACPLKRDSA